jgi:prolyl-tRNA synthetase
MEFLWQEGHTCHETEDEAKKETFRMLDIYKQFLMNIFAIPVVPGEKTPSEKFAGAEQTFCLELMMQDKKALQGCTSHYFGTKFAKAFDIKFQDRNGQLQHVYQTSWGLTTRVIGALIMTHSDDQGLVIPPKAAPTQVMIVPITQKNKDNSQVLEACRNIQSTMKSVGISAEVDDREGQSAGYKFNEWEVAGIPLRVEVGPRDLANQICVFAPRVGEKQQVSLSEIQSKTPEALESLQKLLYDRAAKFLEANTHIENSYSKFQERIETESGFYQMHWCGSDKCEAQVKEETKATIRCIPFTQIKESGKCIYCQSESNGRVIFARSY